MEEWSDDDDDDDDIECEVYTANEIMKQGLLLVNYTRRRIKRAKMKRNIERFKGHFGSKPSVIAQIWEDLQTVQVGEARVLPEDLHMNFFLMAMHHLKRYPTELEREPLFDIDCTKGRDWVWFFVEKIQQLKKVKIVWPADNFGTDLWVLTVDGTHCWIQEITHETWSQDRDFYSHKYGKAGINYELGIGLFGNQLAWMNGPFKAGESDNGTFKRRGLKAKLLATGKRGIADGGYPGNPELLSTPNHHNSKAVKKFKSRALKRHEKFNGMTKNFDCLSGRFRHSVERFSQCFEAVCVICQYQLEMGDPLYDILIEGVIEEE
jgi:hypothetical protein